MGVRRLAVANGPNIFQMLLVFIVICTFYAGAMSCNVDRFLTVELRRVLFVFAESIIPSSGVFVVKLAKRGAGLGITISCKLH